MLLFKVVYFVNLINFIVEIVCLSFLSFLKMSFLKEFLSTVFKPFSQLDVFDHSVELHFMVVANVVKPNDSFFLLRAKKIKYLLLLQ